ncbi:MAG TPA: YdcF family protein [Xanthobacteraceae bacterium]|nr:YdcF family protein [Xanthobacteraceae bacterium]
MTARLETGKPAALRPRPRSMTRRVALALVAGIAILALWAWHRPETLLGGAADLWIVSDEPAPADAIAVLGGGLEYRPFAAADYYRRGLAAKILVSNIGATPAERLGVLRSHVLANSEVLQKLGVPAAAIEPFGDHLSDTFAEATALHEWAVRNGAHRIIVPTDIFATRRLRWTLRHVFGNDAAILVPALNPPDYLRDNWWKNEHGVIGFQNEVAKYLYYRLKY